MAFDGVQDDWLQDLLSSRAAEGAKAAGAQGNGKPAESQPATNGDAASAEHADAELTVPIPKTHRDLQRGALQELVELAADCVSVLDSTSTILDKTVTEAEKTQERGSNDLERQFAKLQEQIAQKYEERKTQIEQKFAENTAETDSASISARRKANAEFQALQDSLKKKIEEAEWMAESVLEAAQDKARVELAAATDTNRTNTEWLKEKDNKAAELMDLYRQKPPQGEALAAIKDAEASADPTTSFNQHKEIIEAQLTRLGSLKAPNLTIGMTPVLAFVLVLIAGVVIPQWLAQSLTLQFAQIGIYIAGGLVLYAIAFFALKAIGKKQVAAVYAPLRRSLDGAKIANQNLMDQAQMNHDVEVAKAEAQRTGEIQHSRNTAAPALEKGSRKKEAALKTAEADLRRKTAENKDERAKALIELEEWKKQKAEELTLKYNAKLNDINTSSSTRQSEARTRFAEEREALEKRWSDGLTRIQEPINENGTAAPPWSDPYWNDYKAPAKFPAAVRFGNLQVNVKDVISELAKDVPFTLPIPGIFNVPALMAFPRQASLLIHTDRPGRKDAIRTLQMIMTRLLTSLPPGRARFTLMDPVGLGQNFSGFMHLGDFDEALVGARIWTEAEQIDHRLENLTEHMETVIQKYLRNEFQTIDEYNAQAGELAEPYRFLVIADYPVKFTDEAFRRLSSIATTGSRCGVYTLVIRDTWENLGPTAHVEDLEAHSVNLVRQDGKFVWRDAIFQRFPLILDEPPEDEQLTSLLKQVGQKAKEAKRVEVPFTSIAPKPDEYWSLQTIGDVHVAVGRSGATRLQSFRLGRGVAQHALVAGKTGSGKSTLLHALISNLAMWYSPEEVELYLIDFKKGVEFKTYAMHNLPHARAIAVESDREFGISVLQRIDAEMTRRSELFRPLKAQNLDDYRETSKQKMPRTLLIIDEFQEFFSEDDKLAQDAALLLDRVVRQGRAFGVHLVLGSQTIGGSSGLSRSTIGQIGVRIALQTSEADSQMILGDGNSAARLLSRPGEAIYNDQGGLVEGNSPFQVAWLADEQRDRYLDLVNAKVKSTGLATTDPIVFEGNEAADYHKNRFLRKLLETPGYPPVAAPVAWLGDPVSIKDPTAIAFRRQSGSNILIVGQADEQAMAILAHSMITLAAQIPPAAASFYILDGTPVDSQLAGVLAKTAAALPQKSNLVEFRGVATAIHEVAEEMKNRQTAENTNPPAIFIIVCGLQRYRNLRKSEDSFSFSSAAGDEEKGPDTGKEFADIMRDGPAVGIHVLSWIDTATALDRTVDRSSMRELDHRILFQMSAADSSNLIDSPMGNKLGANRALSFSEEQGSIEKFRPYALPDAKWLAEVKEKLAAKSAGKQ